MSPFFLVAIEFPREPDIKLPRLAIILTGAKLAYIDTKAL